MPNVNFIKLNHCPEKQLVKHNTYDVGWDIYLTEDTWVYPFSNIPFVDEKNEFKFPLQPTGIVIVPLNYDYWFAIYPRSSVVKRGVQLANSVGIIDPTYTGELFLSLYSLHQPILLQKEKAVAQLVIHENISAEFKEVTADWRRIQRGGFGSTDDN